MFYRTAIIALCLLLLLPGCWSRRELNDLLIVLGIGLDWEDGEYVMTFHVVNPSEISAQKNSEERAPGTAYQGKGKTLFEAARSVTAEAPRKMYAGHLQILVISETLARRGIGEVIDHTLRDNEMRTDFNIVIAKGMRAEHFLKLYTPLQKLPTYNMQQSLHTSEKTWAPTISVTVDEVLDKLSGEGGELALPGIQMIGSPETGKSKKNVESFRPPTRFRFMGIAAFRKGKLVGWLNEKESKGYTDITDNLDSTSIELPCGGNKYTGIEITSSKAKIKTKVAGGKPQATVSIRSEANVVNRGCKDLDLSDPATIQRLEKESKANIKSHAEAAVWRGKKMKTDIFGFGGQLGKEHPGYWKRVKKNWNEEHFPELDIRYKIEMFIRKTGTTGNSTIKSKEGDG